MGKMKEKVSKTRSVYNFFKKISDYVSSKIYSSFIARIFLSYDKLEEKLKNGVFAKLFSRIAPSKKRIVGFKNSFSSRVENSFFYRGYKKLINLLLSSKARLWGVFFLVYGIFSTGIGFLREYTNVSAEGEMSLLWQGVILVLLSVPLISSKEEVVTLLSRGKISSKIVSFFGYKTDAEKKASSGENVLAPVMAGLIFSLLSLIFEPFSILATAFILTIVLVIFNKPETGIIIIALTLPFMSARELFVEVMLVFVAFILKVLRGKRTLKFDLLDSFVLIFALIMFVMSIVPFNKESLAQAFINLFFVLVYLLITNLIKTPKAIKKVLSVSVFSFAISSVIGIYQSFFGDVNIAKLGEDTVLEITKNAVATFDTPKVFGEYLIMLLPVAIALFFSKKSFSAKTFSLFAVVSSAVAMVCTRSPGVIIGCVCSLAIFFVILNKKVIGAYIITGIIVAISTPILPSALVEKALSFLNLASNTLSYRMLVSSSSLTSLLTGMSGRDTSYYANNLYLEIIVQTGIVGLVLFALLAFFIYSKSFTRLKENENTSLRFYAGSVLTSLSTILLLGFFDYVWFDYRIFALFWISLAILSTTLNASKRESGENY